MRESIQNEYQLLRDGADRAAALCCSYVIAGLWDQASAEAKRWDALTEQMAALIEMRAVRSDRGHELGQNLRSVE